MKKVVLILFVTSMMFSTQLFSQKAVAEEIAGSTIQQNDDFYLKNQLKTFFVSVIELSNIKDGSTMSINITGFDNPYNQKVLGDKYTMIQKLSLLFYCNRSHTLDWTITFNEIIRFILFENQIFIDYI